MKITIPYKPRFPQGEIHKELESHRFSVLVAHRRLGKTVLAVNHMIKAALLNLRQAPRYAYIAPFLKQAKMIAWDYLKRYTAVIPNVQVNSSELFVELPNGARLWIFGADNPDAMRGTYFDGVVLDEYAQIKPEVFAEIIRPALSDRNGWAVFVGTPKGQNQFFEVYQQAQKLMNQGDPAWWVGMYRADETKVIKAEELEMMKAVQSDAQFRQEFLCDFTAASDDTLITIDTVTEAAKRVSNPHEVRFAPKVIGVDPARFGDDRSVIFRRQGLCAYRPKVLSKLDNMTLAGHVIQEIEEFQPDAVFVDAGRGEGVIDRCRQLGFDVIEVNFGSQATRHTQYVNKRAEMWDLMREWLEAGAVIPDLPELKAELVTPTYEFDASSRMKLEPKEKLKERTGKSPDLADALAITFAFPVKAKTEVDKFRQQFSSKREEYDPLAM